VPLSPAAAKAHLSQRATHILPSGITETLRPLVTTLVTRNMVVTTLWALNEGRNDPSHITTLPITRGRNDITTPSAVKFLTPKMVGEVWYITLP
jgi:hypothetical protein